MTIIEINLKSDCDYDQSLIHCPVLILNNEITLVGDSFSSCMFQTFYPVEASESFILYKKISNINLSSPHSMKQSSSQREQLQFGSCKTQSVSGVCPLAINIMRLETADV